ncbi:MAG: uroporphyrinogen-III synthase [Bacteroidales bacterium]|jgi:uroporphyrinogen-III synthase|nr:uroporphyrinogen-III synthase [Bacteroidales bacterium]
MASKIKTILVSQPKPANDKGPYFDLAETHNLKIDFRPFIEVVGVPVKDFRKQRVDVMSHTAVIFTSRTAIDHFFRIVEELKFCIQESWKYFCMSESIALYLQKYIVYRKRKIFFGTGSFDTLLDIIKKHKEEKFLLPLSNVHKQDIPGELEKSNIRFSKAILYQTVSADLSDLKDVNYDMLVFFSPSGVASLLQNFPEFRQNSTCIAAFGPTTRQAVLDAGLTLNVEAPTPKSPSMTMAIEEFVKEANKRKR